MEHTTAMGASFNMTEYDQKTLPSGGYIGVAVFLLISGIFGIVSNAVTLVMLMKEKFRSSVDILLFNLAITDLGLTGICFPFVVSSNFAQEWLYGDVGCTMYGFLGFLFGNCSIMTLSAISVERYFIVCKKQSASLLSRETYLVRCLVGLWCYSLFWAIIPLATGIDYEKEPFGTSCTVRWSGQRVKDKVFIAALVILVVAINVVIMVYCYIKILFLSLSQLHPQRREREDFHLSKVCFLLVAVFLVCWLPYAVVSLWATFGHGDDVPTWLTVAPVMTAKLSACLNPVLYVLYSERLRKRYLKLFDCSKLQPIDDMENKSIHTKDRSNYSSVGKADLSRSDVTAV